MGCGAGGLWEGGPWGRQATGLGLLVHEQSWRVRPRGLHTLHGCPLAEAALVGADATLIVGGPEEGHAPGEVIVSPGHLARLVQNLQGRPGPRGQRVSRQLQEPWLPGSLDVKPPRGQLVVLNRQDNCTSSQPRKQNSGGTRLHHQTGSQLFQRLGVKPSRKIKNSLELRAPLNTGRT